MGELELTGEEWKRVHAMARDLARDVDRNELGKVITYMRRNRDPEKFLALLHRLPNSAFIRSRRTRGYLERIAGGCRHHLDGLAPERAVLVAHWAFRLMTYEQSRTGGQRGRRRRR